MGPLEEALQQALRNVLLNQSPMLLQQPHLPPPPPPQPTMVSQPALQELLRSSPSPSPQPVMGGHAGVDAQTMPLLQQSLAAAVAGLLNHVPNHGVPQQAAMVSGAMSAVSNSDWLQQLLGRSMQMQQGTSPANHSNNNGNGNGNGAAPPPL